MIKHGFIFELYTIHIKTMTREEAKELLSIIQAFVEGKAIQDKIEGVTGWCDTDEINFEFEGQKIIHRIKPESQYRPFKTQEECWNEMLKHQPLGWVRYDDSITAVQNIAHPTLLQVSHPLHKAKRLIA